MRLKRMLVFSISLLALIPLGLGGRWGLQQYAQRQISGALSFDPAQLPAAQYPLSAFSVAWEPQHGGQLSVSHQANPDGRLWETLPGQGFVAAAQGVETVTESRSHFFITDSRTVVCSNQMIDSIIAITQTVTIAGALTCGGGREPLDYTLTFAERAPNQLGFALTLADETYNRTYLTYAANPAEHIFGFGTQFSFFDLKGQRLPIFVSEQGIGRGVQPLTIGADIQAGAGGTWYTSYAGVPHYITSQLRSLFLENYEYVVFDMRRRDRMHIQLFAPQMTGRILHGESPADLIETYTNYAGRMRPLPDWLLSGAVIGMQGGTQRVREVWDDLREQDTPVAAFWLQDWVGQRTTSFGKQLWWNWELDEQHYPGWADLVADLAAEDVKVMTYVNPFVVDVAEKPSYRRNLFAEAKERDFLVKQPDGEPYLIRNTDFHAGLIDLTNPAARAWLRDVLTEAVIGAGATGWMADFGEAVPYDAQLFSGEPAASYHNRYPEEWAKLNREVIEASGRGDEFVFFMRAGYRQSPQHATLFWLGDQLVSWDAHDGIKTAVTGLLSSGMSGYSFNHSDIGGYTAITHPIRDYHRSKELLLRWMELNAFTTVYRTHEGNRPSENVQFYTDDETMAHFDRFARVYAAWLPYRKQLVQEAAQTGLPVVRHPFIHYPDDPNVYDLSYQQFMVGTEFMVAPVLDPDTTDVTVYLPAGQWTHLWSGATYGGRDQGTTITVAAPLGEPAVFYRTGSSVAEEFVTSLKRAGILAE